MKNSMFFGMVSRLMIVAIIISTLQGCIIPGNINVDGSSISRSFDSFISNKSGKKDWPFIPTENEKEVSSYTYSVMRQAMTGATVSASFTQDQFKELNTEYPKFKRFMESAPEMREWSAKEAIEYSNYLAKLIPISDLIIAADEGGGSSSDASVKAFMKENKGALNGNILSVPKNSALSISMAAFCADRHFAYPSNSTTPVSVLAPASFVQAVPNELSSHLRNVTNSIASNKVKMSDNDLAQVIWSMTEAGNFTKRNANVLQPANEGYLNKLSPNLYADFSRYNDEVAISRGQKPGFIYGDDRDDILPPMSVVSLPAKNPGTNYPSGIIGDGIYYHISNNSLNPSLTVYNGSSKTQRVDLSRYGLVHDGSEVTQKLVLAGMSRKESVQRGNGKKTGADSDSLALAKNIAMDIERLTISKGGSYLGDLGRNPAFMAHQGNMVKKMASNVFKNFLRKAPMASSMIALSEGVTGEDFISGRQMTGIERGLAFLEATPMPGSRAEAMAAKLNWTKIASAINSYGNSVRGSLYWDAAGFGLEAYKQTLGNTGDYLASKWSSNTFQSEGEKALIFINGSGSAIDKMVAQFGI